MTAISTWSTTAASNNTASPDGAPEGMAPSGVNNTIRENMAQVRTFYNSIEWRDLNPKGVSSAYVSGTSFKTAGADTTGVYTVLRRVHANGSTTGDIYGTVVSSAFSTDTTVVVQWDGAGALQNEALTIEVGFDPTNTPIAGAGGWEVLTPLTQFGAVTEVEVTNTPGYDYRVETFDLQPDVDDAYVVRLFEGAAYKDTSGDYINSYRRVDTVPVTTNLAHVDESYIRISNNDVPAAAPALEDRCSAWLEIYQPDSASVRTNWRCQVFSYDVSDSANLFRDMSGYRDSIAAATKFKLMWAAGNSFNSTGRYMVYRRPNGN